jgi:hypothetical protein
MKKLFRILLLQSPLLFAQCSHPVLAKSEFYLESTKVPFTEGVQTDVRGRYFPWTWNSLQAFIGLQYENYNPLNSGTLDSTRGGPSLGLQLNFLQYFGVVVENRYYLARNSIENTQYNEFRAGLYGYHERMFGSYWLWKSYGEVFKIPRISSTSLTASVYSRLLYLEGHPQALQIAPYLEISGTENSDGLAFGRSLREFKTGLSIVKQLPKAKIEFLLFKNWHDNADSGPSEIRGQLVVFGAWP